jgi:hypothetical protein
LQHLLYDVVVGNAGRAEDSARGAGAEVPVPDYLEGFTKAQAEWVLRQVEAAPPMGPATRAALTDLLTRQAAEAQSRAQSAA